MDTWKEAFKDKWDGLTNFWRCREYKRRLLRFIAWFPVIWKDEDWDEAYLFEIMRFKISRMRKEMKRCARHVNWERDVRFMKIAEELLKRQSFSEFYWENDQKNKQWCTCEPDQMEKCWGIGDDGYRRYKSPFCGWCTRKTQLLRQDKKEKEDFAYLWTIMEKQSRRWGT